MTAARLVMRPTHHSPLHAIVRPVLVDTGAEAGWAHRKGHQSIAPAYLTLRLNKIGGAKLNGNCFPFKACSKNGSRNIAFRDSRVPTHVAHWGRDPPNSNRSVTGD